MTAQEQIILKQVEWAKNRGIQLVGSQFNRGRKVYTASMKDNLFQPLNAETRKNLDRGDGGELSAAKGRTPKIQALHSSSALGVNVFDYWRGRPDLSIATASCGLSRPNHKLSGDVQFEQHFPIHDRFRRSPNLDVVIVPDASRYKAFAIECKFTEAYSSRGHGGMDPKYLGVDAIWQNLTETKRLAQKISPDDGLFERLHIAQLIKHILGLNRSFGHSRYRLLYLWYDAFGKAGAKHREEIEAFADVVREDGVVFHATTYQEVIVRLAQHRDAHPKYVKYLTERYL